MIDMVCEWSLSEKSRRFWGVDGRTDRTAKSLPVSSPLREWRWAGPHSFPAMQWLINTAGYHILLVRCQITS